MAAKAASPTGIPASGATTAVTAPATAETSTIPTQRGLAPRDRSGETSSGAWSPPLEVASGVPHDGVAAGRDATDERANRAAAVATAARADGGPAGTDKGGICVARRRRRA